MTTNEKPMDRRQFLRVMGAGTAATALSSNIAKALEIPAHRRTGTIEDVEHIVVLMQENRPFDHHFGTLRGVRGYNDPRAVQIHVPLASGTGSALASVFLQPAGPTYAAFGVPANYGNLGGPANTVPVIPPFRVDPESIQPGLKSLGGTYFPGTGHGWKDTHNAWNNGQYDRWVIEKNPFSVTYMTRDDVPYHCALADAFTVGDNYFSSVMGPTNPNRYYMWTGCIGNVDYLGAGGTDGRGAGPATYNGLSVNGAPFLWETFPEVLEKAGVSWKIYQDLTGATFAPDFGDNYTTPFAGNYEDNSILYFKQYADAKPGSPLFENAATGTRIIDKIPTASAPNQAWKAWADGLFEDFRRDVAKGTLPQVSWIVPPSGYSEHSDWPMNYGAWYLAQVFDILVSNPEVFSKTVFIINYDEADGSFDHVVPPTPPQSPTYGASTVSIANEIVTTATPNGPIGLGTRVPLLAISPWSKGGYVSSEVFDHSSVIRFMEKRFGVHERNISPWRRAVVGDLTSLFDFANPAAGKVNLPSTAGFLPPPAELAGGSAPSFVPAPNQVILGVPKQEKGIRPARALPYEMNVSAKVNAAARTVELSFVNTGEATVVFHVRSANPADAARSYTVEPDKKLTGSWPANGSYDLSVYGPNGFARFFKGGVGAGAAVLDVRSQYGDEGAGSVEWNIRNVSGRKLTVSVLDAYSGDTVRRVLDAGDDMGGTRRLAAFHGWYDLVVSVAEDAAFSRRLAGHVETGRDSTSDPAMGGLVTLKA